MVRVSPILLSFQKKEALIAGIGSFALKHRRKS